MKVCKRILALLLVVLLLCPVMVQAEGLGENNFYVNNWIVARYEVSQREIYEGELVDIYIWLYNAAETELEALKIAPETSSFNGAHLAYQGAQKDENGYVPVVFTAARYMGEGNTFMMRVDGEVLTLTIHECVPDSEIPQQTPDQTTPVLQVGREDQPKAIAKGESQTVKMWVKNLTDQPLDDVVAVVTPSADLQITDNSVTYPLGSIWRGDVAFFEVTLRAPDAISSASQSLSVEVSYAYAQSDALTRGSSTQTVPLSAVASKETTSMSASVPNVIVSAYDYGTEKIYAGTAFDLNLEFKNTSAVKTVENIVMTIDPGTALAITNSSNSFHFSSVKPGNTQSQSINLQALPAAPTAPAVVTVHFSYEYIDGDERRAVTQDQTISLPVYQLDRFELTQDTTFVEAWQFQESFLTLSYVNKGKSTVYNISAELQGDIPAMSKVQNIGNVEAGRSGTIDFIITPELAGEQTCKVVITYEDDAMQVMQKEFDFEVMVNEMYVPEPMPEEEIMMEEPKANTGWILPVVLGVVAAGLVVLIVILKKRNKKKSGVVDTFVFTDGTEDTDGLS